jgi:D-beta-D-heptose 7-phosphate kinase/D-beta-D-heptose 1-phosphate adenosyltransferase
MNSHTTPEGLRRKIVLDYGKLEEVVRAMRTLEHRIVVTIGSWDLFHIGHARYLLRAAAQGDILIVGVDSDAAIKRYKGELRPFICEDERCEILVYQAYVDFVTLIRDVDERGKWGYELIRRIRPDVFVAVEDSYPEQQIEDIKQFCGELVCLPRQAQNTSTSRIVEDAVKKHIGKLLELTMERK